MANIGLSKPYFAVYSNTGTTVNYANGGVLGKYTEIDLSLDDGGDNVLYADNAPAESDLSFAGGTLTITTDDLRPEVAQVILGTEEEALTGTGIVTEDAAWLVHNDNQAPPYVGVGGILKKKIGGINYYVAFVLDKIRFNNPGIAVTTQGETIEWQTPELTARVFRSDKATHDWFRKSTLLSSEAEAEAAVMQYLGITAAAASTGGGAT